MKLTDLNDTGTAPSLEDFNPVTRVGSVLNRATVTNAAAHASLLSNPEDVTRNYSIISAELADNSEGSPSLNALLEKNKTVDQAALHSELNKILGDPSIPSEEKMKYMDGYISATSAGGLSKSLSVLVAEKALAESTGPEENDETLSTTLFDLGSTLDQSDEYRGYIQREINFKTGIQDRAWYDWVADFTENVIPFMDQASVAKTQLMNGDAGTALKSLILPGDSKAKMRDAIAKMPLDQRMKVAKSLIELVKTSGGSITPRTNTMNMVNQLNAYLVNGNYRDGDQLVDNIFAAIDVIVPFADGFMKFAKGTKTAADIERAMNSEAKAIKMAEDVEEVIVKAIPEDEVFDANETTLTGIKQLIHDTISPQILKGVVPYGDVEAILKKVDDLVVQPNLSNPKKLAKDIASIVQPVLGKKTKKTDVANQFVKYIEEESNTNRLMVRAIEDYNSIAATFRNSNPKKARALNNIVEADKTDQAAKITYGTTRQEAIASDRAPEVGNIDKSVRTKVEMDEAGPNPDAETINAVKKDKGRTDLTPEEKAATRKTAIDAFQNVKGLTPRKAMATVDENTYVETPTGASFNMVYGPKDGGFVNAAQGLYQVLTGLKKYGVTGKEVEVLSRSVDGKYHVVTGLPTEKGNYLIRVKHDYEFAPGDVVEKTLLESDKNYRVFESRHNITDGNAGGLLQHFIPASAIIDKVIFNSASVASDATAKIQRRLIKLAAQYAKSYKKLSARQKLLVDDYRIEANNKGIPFSSVNLKARGFDEDAIQTMRDWKTTTDTMWWLENVDANKNLRSLGWQRFSDTSNDTDLIAKPVTNRGLDGAKVYDPSTNTIRKIDDKELKDLYDKNGQLAELKRPLIVGDDDADYVLVREGASGYLRRIRDEDTTLPYRDGYYPIKYDAPIFIRKKFLKKDGGEYYKAIAVAGNHGEANALVTRLRETDNAGEYVITGDLKRGTNDYADAEWDVVVSTGRSAQRVRGTRLADASSPTDLNHVHVESPEESLVSSIKSIASRTAFRDWMETSKSRWLANYGKLIDSKNPNQWPSSVKQIGAGNLEHSNALIKDAKANWRYINAMESGYVNILDDASKNFFANFADTAGRKGWGWLEGPARALAKGGPSTYARKKAFRLLLAANPLRQLPVQAMQALPVLLATNPLAIPKIASQMILLDYLAKGGDATSFMKGVAKAATGMDGKSAKELAEHWESSGFEAAVEAHTLIRDEIGSLVDRTPWAKAKSIAAKPLDLLQKVGFNAGERLLMRSVWLSEYDLLRKSGKVINAETLENLNARVRNLTLNMNRAGEMPYNENLFSAALQFFQAPHKAFAQILLGHKGLSGTDRLKLGASYILTYGIGAGPVTNMIMSGFKGDPEVREKVEGGVFNMALNAALRSVFKDETNIDFSDSLRLLPQPDVFKFWDGMMRADIPELLSSSPSASLILGNSPRVTNFVTSLMRPFVVDNDQKPEALMLIGKNFADMFSGASNFMKAKYALEHQKLMSSKGVVNDWNVTPVESIGKLMGFATEDEIHYYAAQEATYKATEAYKKDIKLLIDEVSSRLADQGMSNDEQGWYINMLSEAQRVFGNDPVYMNEFANQIRYKAMNGEYSIYLTLRRLAGAMDANEYDTLVDKSDLPPDMKNTLKQSKRMFEEIN